MKRIVISAVLVAAASLGAFAQSSPYVGLQTRPIKALSSEQIDDYLAGRGMGFALAAELNAYPGPRHVLDLGDRLDLTGEQRAQLEAIYAEMSRRAVEIGKSIVHLEAQLDALFASGQVNEEILSSVLKEIGDKQAELRFVHLDAHLRTKRLMSAGQVAAYSKLRGYSSHLAAAGHQHHD